MQREPCWCRPAYLALQSLRDDFPGAPFLACTATATKRVKDSIIASLGLKSPVILESSFNSEHCCCQTHHLKPGCKRYIQPQNPCHALQNRRPARAVLS